MRILQHSFAAAVTAVLLTGGPMLAAQELANGANVNASDNSASVPDDEMRRATTNPVRGEVVAVEKNAVTVLDITTGREVTFTVAEKTNKVKIHRGDRVRVIFSKGNPNVASAINKE